MTLMHRNSLALSIVVLVVGFLAAFTIVAGASSKGDIVFPVQELGGCENEAGLWV